nr:unnamed protein product [Callosobruchus chinensis]
MDASEIKNIHNLRRNIRQNIHEILDIKPVSKLINPMEKKNTVDGEWQQTFVCSASERSAENITIIVVQIVNICFSFIRITYFR